MAAMILPHSITKRKTKLKNTVKGRVYPPETLAWYSYAICEIHFVILAAVQIRCIALWAEILA